MSAIERFTTVFFVNYLKVFFLGTFTSLTILVITFISMGAYLIVGLPLYVIIALHILKMMRHEETKIELFHGGVFNGKAYVRNLILMLIMYLVPLFIVLLAFIFLLLLPNPLYPIIERYDLTQYFRLYEILHNSDLAVILVLLIPFVLSISFFSFLPHVIADAKVNESTISVLKRGVKTSIKGYHKIVAVRLVTLPRMLVITLPLAVFALGIAGMADDGGELGRSILRYGFYVSLAVYLLFLPLFHTLMCVIYEGTTEKMAESIND